jgi:hypothetical protein
MNKKTYLITMFVLLMFLLALKPLAPTAYNPNNDLWSYTTSAAGESVREINCVRPTPLSNYSCQVVTHSGGEVFGLGSTPQTALDNALNNLP